MIASFSCYSFLFKLLEVSIKIIFKKKKTKLFCSMESALLTSVAQIESPGRRSARICSQVTGFLAILNFYASGAYFLYATSSYTGTTQEDCISKEAVLNLTFLIALDYSMLSLVCRFRCYTTLTTLTAGVCILTISLDGPTPTCLPVVLLYVAAICRLLSYAAMCCTTCFFVKRKG